MDNGKPVFGEEFTGDINALVNDLEEIRGQFWKPDYPKKSCKHMLRIDCKLLKIIIRYVLKRTYCRANVIVHAVVCRGFQST